MKTRQPKRADPFYLSPNWRKTRLRILERDNYRCVKCGADVFGKGQARVDHVKPRSTHPHLALEPSNLRTLCVLHDHQAHRERARGGGGDRVERFTMPGADAEGWPVGR